jgi:hypothetical protein
MKYRRYRGEIILLLLAAVSHSALAFAEPSSSQKNMARPLTLQGREKLNAGDATTASKLFQAAHAIMHSPVTGMDVAKAEVALGHLVEARDMALEVTRIPVSPREPNVVKDARSAAVQLAADLAERIPTLVIRVAGPRPALAAASVRVDGTEIQVAASPPQSEANPRKKVETPTAAISSPREVNPGEHTVEVSARGYVNERRAVTLEAGQSLMVELKLSRLAPVSPPQYPQAGDTVPLAPRAVSGAPQEISSNPASAARLVAPAPERTWQRPLAVAAMGLGVAGLGVGSALGGLAIATNSESNSHCDEQDQCNPRGLDLRRKALGLAHGSTAAVIAGGILASGGLVLFFTAPSSPKQKKPGKSVGAIHALPVVEITPGALQIRGTW